MTCLYSNKNDQKRWISIMVRHVDRKFIIFTLETYFLAQNCHYFNCVCFKYQQFQNLLKQIKKNKFFTSNSKQKKWL